jgi:ribosomal protein S18 acetylase RimI-like enzyme
MASLHEIERYYDGVPRSVAFAEIIGPFTLFVNAGPGWPYYARPTLGAQHFTAQDVQLVRERQRRLQVPESFEWVAETTPALDEPARAAGLVVGRHPLMVYETNDLIQRPPADPADPAEVEVRLVMPSSDDLALLSAIAEVAFTHAGTAVGPQGIDDARSAVKSDPAEVAFRQERLRLGRTVMVEACIDGEPVGVGSHTPLDGVTEIVGVAVLPAFRRRGIAAALTSALVEDALRRDIGTIFLSAGDADVARVYERIGFRTIATACIAEP